MIIEKSINKLRYLFFVPLLIYIGERSLIAFDEGFYAMQARWIIEKSNWVGPLFWDQVSSDRTIGIQFLIAISKKLFGDSLFVIYIPIFSFSYLYCYCHSYVSIGIRTFVPLPLNNESACGEL